jgi:alpha-acetolactate decarboxylase
LYEKPICDCSGELIFIEGKKYNKNLKHNVYKIKANGTLGKIIGERELTPSKDIFSLMPENFTECKDCKQTWKTDNDEKGRIR